MGVGKEIVTSGRVPVTVEPTEGAGGGGGGGGPTQVVQVFSATGGASVGPNTSVPVVSATLNIAGTTPGTIMVVGQVTVFSTVTNTVIELDILLNDGTITGDTTQARHTLPGPTGGGEFPLPNPRSISNVARFTNLVNPAYALTLVATYVTAPTVVTPITAQGNLTVLFIQ